MSQPALFDFPRPRTLWATPSGPPDLRGHQRLYVDTESDGLDPRKSKAIGQSITTPLGWSCYLPHGHLGGGNLDERRQLEWTRSDSGLKGKHLYFLNGKHDLCMFRNWGVDLEAIGCQLHDISFREALLDDRRGHGGLDLNSLAISRLGEQKAILPRVIAKDRMHETHASEVGAYAEQDSRLLWQLDRVYEPLIEAEDLGRVLALEDSLIYCVAHMERHGLRLDQEKARLWHAEVRAQYGELILEIWRLTGLKVNPNSGPDLSRLFKKLGLEVKSYTEKGKESFPASELEKFKHPVMALVIKARRLDSLTSRYLKKFVAAGSHLYYSLHQLKGDKWGTISGRFSGTNMSHQIMKVARQIERLGEEHIIRELVIPDDGQKLLAADARQIEPRLFVHYAQDPRLLAAYKKDPNLDFYDDLVLPMLLKIQSFQQMPKKTQRLYTKVGTLGKFYGLSNEESAAEQLKCTEGEAEAFMREYDQAFPAVRALMKLAMRLAERRGYVKTILGRRARFPEKQHLHTVVNRVIQGSAADINKVKLKELYGSRALLGISKLRLTLHDEFVGDIDPDPMYKARVQELLDVQSVETSVPILWSADTGTNWRECS